MNNTSNSTTNNPTAQPSDKPLIRKKCAQDFKFIGLIGEGSFSMVALAVDTHTKQKYAIKICEKRQLLKENKAKAIMREKDILNLLDSHSSPYFIRLHFSFQDSHRLFFGLSFARGGELLTYINKLSGFNEECTRFYSAQILLALEYLHKLGIIHRDLKPENLLLNDKMQIQITDFGSAFQGSTDSIKPTPLTIRKKRMTKSRSKERTQNGGDEENKNGDAESDREETDDEDDVENNKSDEKQEDENNSSSDESRQQHSRYRAHNRNNNKTKNSRSNSFVGTAQYVSPEMITCARCFTSSDLWAYGCIIYQMLVGSPPFNDATDYLIFHKILALNLTFPDDKIYPEAEDLIKSLLTLDPCSRLGASDDFTLGSYPSIRSHPFFTEISQPAKITVSTSPLSSSSSSSKSPSSNLPGPSFFNPANQYPQTRWSTLHLERPPLLDFLNKEDYDLESRISCLNYDDIEPGLDEGLLLGLGLSDYPKKSESPFEKVDSTTSSSTSPPPTQRTGYNNISSNSRGGINFNSRFCKNSSSHKENSRSNNNPERSKKKGLFSKLFKH